jgi:synaptobrevin family protein YKT6
MKVYGILGFKFNNNENELIFNVNNLLDINFFYRPTVNEFFIFTIKNILNKIEHNINKNIEADKYNFYLIKINEFAISIITDSDYPSKLCKILLDEFINYFMNSSKIEILTSYMSNKLIEIQNVDNCNILYKVQMDLDKTTEIMRETIALVMDRGEKLDELIKSSNDLSEVSKKFYEKSKKSNCCGMF